MAAQQQPLTHSWLKSLAVSITDPIGNDGGEVEAAGQRIIKDVVTDQDSITASF
jgi:hypothetical protein